jgi:hypothetical protein
LLLAGWCMWRDLRCPSKPGISNLCCSRVFSASLDLHIYMGGTFSQTVRLFGLWLVLASQQYIICSGTKGKFLLREEIINHLGTDLLSQMGCSTERSSDNWLNTIQ